MSRHFDSVIEPADAPEPDAPMTEELIDEFYLNIFYFEINFTLILLT